MPEKLSAEVFGVDEVRTVTLNMRNVSLNDLPINETLFLKPFGIFGASVFERMGGGPIGGPNINMPLFT